MEPITDRKVGYEVGLGQKQALGLDFSSSRRTMIGQTTYIKQTVLLNTPLDRKCASATEPSLRQRVNRIPCAQTFLMGIYHLVP